MILCSIGHGEFPDLNFRLAPSCHIKGKQSILLMNKPLKLSDTNKAFKPVYFFENISVFHHKGCTCILFPFEGVDLDVGKLAMWRLQTHEMFGGTWLSDYVPNRLGGFVTEEQSKENIKPKCPLIGADGNIWNLMGIASNTLKHSGMADEAKEMCNRITSSGSYDEALCILGEYVEICSEEDMEEDPEIDLEGGMSE